MINEVMGYWIVVMQLMFKMGIFKMSNIYRYRILVFKYRFVCGCLRLVFRNVILTFVFIVVMLSLHRYYYLLYYLYLDLYFCFVNELFVNLLFVIVLSFLHMD